jgi:uncharacterized protein YndB with AHSA1/START domain
MTKPRLDRPLRAEIEIAASPTQVWRVVADMRRTPEWSPECRRVLPLGTVRQGGWLLGFNRRKHVWWATVSRIVSYNYPDDIGWRVITNGSIWSYRLTPRPAGTLLEQNRQTPHGVSAFARGFTRLLLGGQRIHDDELEDGMRRGLARIKRIAEAHVPEAARRGSTLDLHPSGGAA